MSESTITTYDRVAVEPFPDTHVKTDLIGPGKFGVAKINNTRAELIRLKVVFRSCFSTKVSQIILNPDTASYGGIYVRASDYSLPWAKDVFELEGKKFILVPADRVEMVS